MAYEFTSFTEDAKLSGIYTQTSFISFHESPRQTGELHLSHILRGEIRRYYDEESKVLISKHREEMAERSRDAKSQADTNDTVIYRKSDR